MNKTLMAKTGTYQKDGETKNRWTRVGVVRSNQHGKFMMLDAVVNPAALLILQNLMSPDNPRTSVMISMFDDDDSKSAGNSNDQAQSKPAEKKEPAAGDDWDDDIPF